MASALRAAASGVRPDDWSRRSAPGRRGHEHSALAQPPPCRYAGTVFTVQVKQPQSIAGRCWNATQDVLALGALALIVLKLTGVITWPWWWVLSPLWISGILLVAALGVVLVLLIRAAPRELLRAAHEVEIAETPDSADGTLP
jgi:hypothetical protein